MTPGQRREDWAGVPVVITTSRRIVYCHWDPRDYDAATRTAYDLRGARNALTTDTTRGVCEVAVVGPGPNARIEMPADVWAMADVCFIRPCTPAAVKRWESIE